MYCVRVSARLLHFPDVCCCCGCSGADNRFQAVATRTTGKKVVRTDSRSWSFPLCGDCERWIRQQQVADIAHAWFMGLVVLAILGVVGGVALLPRPSGGVAIFLGVLAGAIVPFVYKNWQQCQEAANRVKPARHCVTEPVIYEGWQGTVHTFYFSCHEFTERFQAGNARKVLRQ